MNDSDRYLIFEEAKRHWQSGRALDAGRLLFESLEPDARSKLAATILILVTNRTKVRFPAIVSLLGIANDSTKWTEAHRAFSKIREATLELERAQIRSRDEEFLLTQLYLAENVAKVIYNATNPLDPFDEDSASWVIACLKCVLDLLHDDAFSSLVLQTLEPAK